MESRRGGPRSVTAAEIVLDAEFCDLFPPLSCEERDRRQWSLAVDGCLEPLIVWRCGARLVLLIGYEMFPYLKLHGIPFQAVEKEFANRDQARMFIILHLLGRSDLGPLWVSYLRGLRYVGTKQPHGGDRRSKWARRAGFATLKSAEALAEMLCVTPRTIRHDGALVTAVHRIMDQYGPAVRAALLSPASRLSRDGVLALAKLPQADQGRLVGQLLVQGKLPRSWRGGGRPTDITLPRALRPMAETLVRRLGMERAADLARLLSDVLNEQRQACPALADVDAGSDTGTQVED